MVNYIQKEISQKSLEEMLLSVLQFYCFYSVREVPRLVVGQSSRCKQQIILVLR